MFASTTIRSAFALPALSALLLILCGKPSLAQASHALGAGTPGQVRVMTGQAATVVSSVHYQAELHLTCASYDCDGNFPILGAHRRLNVTRMNCLLSATPGSTFRDGQLALFGPRGFVLEVSLPVDYSSTEGAHTLNQAVDLQVASAQHLYVELRLVNGGTFNSGICTATGTLDTLQ